MCGSSPGGTTLKTPLLEGFFVFYAKNITWVISKVINLISTKIACFNPKVCISFVNSF